MQFDFDELKQMDDGRITSWFKPSGSTFLDGLRLGIINVVFLVALLIMVSVTAIILRALGLATWLVSIASILFVIAVCGAFGALVWTKYAGAHHRAAGARGRQSRGDVFGAIAAVPFVCLALLLLSTGVLTLFFSIITLSADRTSDALFRVLYGLLFAAAAAGNLVAARDRRGYE